jgi:hypothetical protein
MEKEMVEKASVSFIFLNATISIDADVNSFTAMQPFHKSENCGDRLLVNQTKIDRNDSQFDSQ